MYVTLLRRISIVWALLVLATILSFGMEWLLESGKGASYSVFAIIAISFIKVRFVILDFMEVRTAPLVLRLISELWVIATAAMLIATYYSLATLV